MIVAMNFFYFYRIKIDQYCMLIKKAEVILILLEQQLYEY